MRLNDARRALGKPSQKASLFPELADELLLRGKVKVRRELEAFDCDRFVETFVQPPVDDAETSFPDDREHAVLAVDRGSAKREGISLGSRHRGRKTIELSL